MDLGLRMKVCVVTGSTGGIGREVCPALAEEGALVVTSRSQHARAGRGDALDVACDLSEPGVPEALWRARRPRLGPVACLVNNVGAAYQVGFEELSDDQWDALWQLNVMSYVRAIRAVSPRCASEGPARS